MTDIDAASSTTVPADNNSDWSLLTSALAADALDSLGRRQQCLGPDIRPLALSQTLVARAFPVRSQASLHTNPERPYEGLMAALDDITPGQVFVFGTNRSDAAGVWGELVTTACMVGGIAGALTDGLIRDVTRVLEKGFPTFSRGATPYDSKGRVDVTEHNVPILIDGVVINPGDLVVGDADGVCIVPADLEDQVLDLVREKTEGEGSFRAAVTKGMSASEAFRTYRVL